MVLGLQESGCGAVAALEHRVLREDGRAQPVVLVGGSNRTAMDQSRLSTSSDIGGMLSHRKRLRALR